MSRSSFNYRGDLLRLSHSLGEDATLKLTEGLGFIHTVQPDNSKLVNDEISIKEKSNFLDLQSTQKSDESEHDQNKEHQSLSSFLVPMALRIKHINEKPPELKDLLDPEIDSITKDELAVDWSVPDLDKAPLMPWSRLWPRLKKRSKSRLPGRKPDVPGIVKVLSRMQVVRKLPRQEQDGWSEQWLVLLDKRSSMTLFEDDIRGLVQALSLLRGREGMKCLVLAQGRYSNTADVYDFFTGKPEQVTVSKDAPVLLISDMGQLEGDTSSINYWKWLGDSWLKKGLRLSALVPCPKDRWNPSLQRIWNSILWDRASSMDSIHSGDSEGKEDAVLEALLNAFAPAAYITPALLRQVRLLLALEGKSANCGHEFDLWRHRDMGQFFSQRCISPEAAKNRFENFSDFSPKTKQVLADLYRDFYRGASCLVRDQVLITLKQAGAPLPEAEAKLYEQHKKSLQAMFREDKAVSSDLTEWYQRVYSRLASPLEKNEFYTQAWAASYYIYQKKNRDHGSSLQMPGDLPEEQKEIARKVWDAMQSNKKNTSVKQWFLEQRGHSLHFRKASEKVDTSTKALAEISCKIPRIELTSRLSRVAEKNKKITHGLFINDPEVDMKVPVKMSEMDHMLISTDAMDTHLWKAQLPPWSQRMGYDRYGLYAELKVKGVSFRLRWIAPGRFMMGSPDDEDGRSDDEKLHEVVITKGYWMAETQTTQELWRVVMGKNPSKFDKGKDCPVDDVSWEDCVAFCHKLEAEQELLDEATGKPCLSFSLPTEAQWEYACRAGTQSAYSWGDTFELGRCNAENNPDVSGAGKNVETFRKSKLPVDSTMPVKTFSPNGWGLYDMHGNVLEWCRDRYDEAYYRESPQEDPQEPDSGLGLDSLDMRVLRGGRYWFYAWSCRSAYRGRSDPSYRGRGFGFRLVAGQKVSSSKDPEGQRKAEQERSKGAGGSSSTQDDARARTVRGAKARRTQNKQGQHSDTKLEAKLVGLWDESSRETVASFDFFGETKSRVVEEKPGWASEMITDTYGRLAMIDIKGVGFSFRKIEPGEFIMGSPLDENGRSHNEVQHKVRITRGYWMGVTPVTQEQWEIVMRENPSHFKGEDKRRHPVETVSWEQVQVFNRLLVDHISEGDFRLPTEAEWEYACRAGTESAYNNGKNCTEPEGEDPAMEEVGWYSKNSGNMTHEVGQKQANGWGLYDMHGNVWEWCRDRYDEAYYRESPQEDPQGPDSGYILVLRGGGYWNGAGVCRSACRSRSDPSGRGGVIGFRLVVGQK
ncbi:MAG: formylglycine-generating enzyme family protein [Verrucomicrobiota bacterium]